MGFDIPPGSVLSAPAAARAYLRERDDPPCKLLLRDSLKADFRGLAESDDDAQAVVIGDIGDA